MLLACWSVKGGSGTTVVAAVLASVLARSRPEGVLLADLCGDAPAVLGAPEPSGPGLSDWLRAGRDVPADALHRLEVDLGGGLHLLPRGEGPLTDDSRADVLGAALAGDARHVVADCGVAAQGPALTLAAVATCSFLVIRPCYLALRRATVAAVRPSGIVLLREVGRALDRTDVEDVVGAPVVMELDVDPAIARSVDAGLLRARLPRPLNRAVARALERAA